MLEQQFKYSIAYSLKYKLHHRL